MKYNPQIPYSGPKYITIQEVIDGKKVADRWGLSDPYPNISVPMDKEWWNLKYCDSSKKEGGDAR